MRGRWSRSWILVLGAFFAACGAHRAPPSAPVTDPAQPTAPKETPLALDDAMEARLRELETLHDARGTYGNAPQAPANSFRSIAPLGRFPASKVARATMVTFGHSGGGKEPCAREAEPLRADGTFCSDVRTGHTDLSDEERQAVLGLPQLMMAADPKAPRPASFSIAVTRCDFDPHHGIVFFDAKGVPVARIVICLSCNEWIVAPASEPTGGARPTIMPKDARALFVRIAEAHGLAPWIFDDEQQRALQTYVRDTYGTEEEPTALGRQRRRTRLATGSGLPRDRALRDLGANDRAKLCTWVNDEVRPEAGRSRRSEGYGYECADGTEWMGRPNETACAARELPCASSVATLEACLLEFREPESLCGPPPKSCEGLLDCIPGLVRKSPR